MAAGACVAAGRFDAAPTQRVRLSLSVRVAEPFFSKETSTKTIEKLIARARSNGYAAVGMRGSQAGIHSPPEREGTMMHPVDRSPAWRLPGQWHL